jgi:hypothetical protein
MNKDLLNKKVSSIIPWSLNYGDEMEYRNVDGMSWYDLSINCNSLPCEPEIAIIVTSWFGQLKWLKSTLEGYRKSGAFVILAYDNPFYSWTPVNQIDITRCMPNMKHYMLSNSFVMKHLTYDANKRNGWFWDVRYAQGIIKQFKNIKYVYCTNGDCIIEKPDGFKDIIGLLGNNDLMSGQSTESVIHTADVLYKVNAFHTIFDSMFEIMKVPVIGSRSPEGMLRDIVLSLKLKVLHAPVQPLDKDGTVDMYARYGPASTWRDLLGFRNLFAEYETFGNEGREPFGKEYVDDYLDWIYWSGEERETICKFWETGDRRYLMMWWDRWEDSDYNRLYYPIEYYGKEPIYDKKGE